MKNLDYRPFGATFKFVIGMYVSFIALLGFAWITPAIFENLTLGIVGAFIAREGFAKIGEAIKDRGLPAP